MNFSLRLKYSYKENINYSLTILVKYCYISVYFKIVDRKTVNLTLSFIGI
jgi:hypothetical protein